MKPTLSIFLANVRNDVGNITLRISNYGHRKFYIIDKCKPSHWEKPATHGVVGKIIKVSDAKRRNGEILNVWIRAKNISDELWATGGFSLTKFDQRFTGRGQDTNIISYFNERILHLDKQGRASTASSYESTMHFLEKAWKHKAMLFDDITSLTIDYLKNYGLNQNLSINSINIYLRTFRAVYNRFYAEYDLKPKTNPWNRAKIASVRRPKKVLTPEEVAIFYNTSPKKDTPEWLAKTVFMFSLLVDGINLVDMQQLTWRDINDGKIHWIRSKTDTSSHEVKISQDIKKILDHYRQFRKKDSDYVFPFLSSPTNLEKTKYKNGEITKEQMMLSIKKRAVKYINKYLRRLAEANGISTDNFSFYSARHSFASILDDQGIDRRVIQKMLGHSSLNVTEGYINSLQTDKLQEAREKLEVWKKNV